MTKLHTELLFANRHRYIGKRVILHMIQADGWSGSPVYAVIVDIDRDGEFILADTLSNDSLVGMSDPQTFYALHIFCFEEIKND